LFLEHLSARLSLGGRWLETLQIAPGARELGAVFRFGRNRQVQGRLERPWVDLRDQIAGLHRLAFHETDLLHLPVDTGSNRDSVKRLYGAQAFEIYRHIYSPSRCGLDRNRLR